MPNWRWFRVSCPLFFSSFNTFVWSNFQLVWSHLPGAWYDDGAPRWLREKRRLLRCVLLWIEPSRIKSDGSTTAFVVGGHLSILPCLWEAWALNFQNIGEMDVCLGMECMLLKKVFWVGISVLNGGLEKVSQQPNQEFDISTMMAYSQVYDALPRGRAVLFLRKGGQRRPTKRSSHLQGCGTKARTLGSWISTPPSYHISSHLPCQIPECNLSSFQETLGIFVEPGCERLCGSVQQRLGAHGLQWFYRVFGKNWAIHWPGSHLLVWKKLQGRKWWGTPKQILVDEWPRKKSRKTVPNLLFESFWIVSKVSKEEVFTKTGVDLTKTAFWQRENMAFPIISIAFFD